MWLTFIEHQHSCQTGLLSLLICTYLVFSDLPSLSWFILNLGLCSKDIVKIYNFLGIVRTTVSSVSHLLNSLFIWKVSVPRMHKKSGGISKGNIESFMCTFFTTHNVNRESFRFSGKSQKFVWADFFLFLPLRLKEKKSIMKTWSKCTSIWMDKWFRMKLLCLKEYLAHMICLLHDLK